MARFLKSLIFFLTLPLVLFPQSQDLIFDHLSVDDGLSNVVINSILQDSRGFMWFATEDGLNKYDGYDFTVYRHDPDDSLSISDNNIYTLHESYYGGKHVLWIGTEHGGLNKLDLETEQFTYFKNDPTDLQSLSHNRVVSIYEDSFGELWIGTQRGINKFNRKSEKFKRYQRDLNDPTSLSSNLYCTITESPIARDSILWVGTWDGLNKFDRKTEKFTHFKHDRNNPNSLSNNNINNLYFDSSGILWIPTMNGGLNKFNIKTEQFTRFQYDPHRSHGISYNMVVSVLEDNFRGNKVLWLATFNGLNKLDPETEQFTHFKHNPGKLKSLCDNHTNALYRDKTGCIWIGTFGGGLSKFDPGRQKFAHIQQETGNLNSLSHKIVLSITGSKYFGPDVFWIGTKDGGLNKYDKNTGNFTHYRHDPGNPNSLSSDFVITLLETHYQGRHELWVGTIGGLGKFDLKTNKFTRYQYDPDDPYSISDNVIRSIFDDNSGMLWVGTRNGGLNRFDRSSGKFRQKRYYIGEVISIIEDYTGTLWAGTNRGLAHYNSDSDDFTHYLHDPDDPYSISHSYVLSMYEDKSSRFWIGTKYGLNLFNRETNRFTRYMVKDGLPSNVINGILEDDFGNLWLSTNHGLSKFNPGQKAFRNYDMNDGMQSNQFAIGAYCLSQKGEMLFGGANGFNVFHPESIADNPHIPEIHFTEFKIFNKKIDVNAGVLEDYEGTYYLPKHISNISEITLSYKESVFSFEFAALNYNSPQKNQYAYKMDGVDPDWVYTDASRRYATYTQLDPGEYVFRVKGSNNDGLWNEEGTSIKIIITPPWWKTNLAYMFYVFLFGFTVFGVWRFQISRLKIKHELELEHVHAEKLEEVNHMKSRFFTNISHEFRTPLTLILGPVKNALAGEYGGNVSELYHMIIRNGERLLQLINQILDLSKIESGRMALQVTKTNLSEFIKEIVCSFSSLAETKKVILRFNPIDNTLMGFIDRDKIEKIITNLLSNALKCTPEDGEVFVDLNAVIPAKEGIQKKKWIPHQVRDDNNYQLPVTNYDFLEITISNTGTGISANQQDKIFDRFYQADDNYKKDGEGTGIGLALTKELVEVCHGEITVESVLDKLTTFTVILPISKEHFQENEIVEKEDTTDHRVEIPYPGSRIAYPESDSERRAPSIPEENASILSTHRDQIIHDSTSIQHPVSSILIVEDNPDVISYICSFMENDYQIITAENGTIGLKKARKKYPDLIISDVMMPEMDGFEMCRKIKSDERISHIPIILLTAKADLDSKIDGLEFGADDYVTKPFESRELQIRSKNLIKQRRKLREKFTQLIDLKPEDISASSMDEQFMERLLSVFENHLEDPEFSTATFAREVGLSRVHLNRKLQALTDQSTHDFIRTLRLQRAARLLRNASGTVSEIAYKVGFNNLSHFSKAFRQHFGQLPSTFAKKKI